MIVFPNCKINLGLNIIGRLPNGYHELHTVMVPVPWCDILEIVPAKGPETTLHTSGRPVDCPTEKNLVMKAYRAVAEVVGALPCVDIYLEKIVPDGAGLGGGSSDAAFTIRALNDLFSLGMTLEQMADIASRIGADCPFFIYNRPMAASGIGTSLCPIDIQLQGYTILIAKPRDAHVSTRDAYAGVLDGRHTNQPPVDLFDTIASTPIDAWQRCIHNDFERTVMAKAPVIAQVKEAIMRSGAIYTAMSGSGAAVFGIYDNAELANACAQTLPHCDTFVGPLYSDE